jgi:hypothetical protein
VIAPSTPNVKETTMRIKRKKIRWIAVAGERDRTFTTYDKACEWLDKVSPETANATFTTEEKPDDEDDPMRTIYVRHTT